MKKLVLITGLLFAMQTALFAQVFADEDFVVFNAHLLKTFDLTVTDGATQDITFAVAADYNNGVIGGLGILPGSSTITVEATGDWQLQISAPDFVPYAGPNGAGTGTIPINNLGVYCDDAPAVHKFGTEVTCAHQTDADALGLTIADQLLIGLGTGGSNAGDPSDNTFTLNWLMGTRQGSMNTLSMFEQLTADVFVFGLGDFTTTATLTLQEMP